MHIVCTRVRINGIANRGSVQTYKSSGSSTLGKLNLESLGKSISSTTFHSSLTITDALRNFCGPYRDKTIRRNVTQRNKAYFNNFVLILRCKRNGPWFGVLDKLWMHLGSWESTQKSRVFLRIRGPTCRAKALCLKMLDLEFCTSAVHEPFIFQFLYFTNIVYLITWFLRSCQFDRLAYCFWSLRFNRLSRLFMRFCIPACCRCIWRSRSRFKFL